MSGLKKFQRTALAISMCLLLPGDARAQAQSTPPAPSAPAADDTVERLLQQQLEPIVQAGDLLGYLDLVAGTADRGRAIDFGRSEILPGATRVVIQERERIPFGSSLEARGYRVAVDVFVEFGQRARIATWQIDIQRRGESWQIVDQERLTSVENCTG